MAGYEESNTESSKNSFPYLEKAEKARRRNIFKPQECGKVNAQNNKDNFLCIEPVENSENDPLQ